jgi:hypothetical protein
MEESENSIPPKSANSEDQHQEATASVDDPNIAPQIESESLTEQDPKSTLQSTEMEVHHHSHIRHRKEWLGYLFEFLMLFLAVTAGFFVENRREHYIEHKRAEQFSRQLLKDLRLDSLLFEDRNKHIRGMTKGHDSLRYLLTRKGNATDKEILEALLPLSFAFDIPAITTTYNQMKTSGALRYIENTDLTTSLQQYYDYNLPRSIRIAEASLNYYTAHINAFFLQHIRIQDIDSYEDTLMNKNPTIIGRTAETDQKLANIMGGYRSLLRIQLETMNEPALKKIREIIPVLKREYHLK